MRREKDPILVASRAPSVEPVLRIFTQRHDRRDVGACDHNPDLEQEETEETEKGRG